MWPCEHWSAQFEILEAGRTCTFGGSCQAAGLVFVLIM